MTDRRREYRSNFEPGSTRWAVRRAQWIAMGIDEADFHKPKIAVVNTSSKLSVCFQHLDEVAETVSAAIRKEGGLPFEIRTAASSDFVTSAGRQGRYLMPTRDLMSFDIEVQVEGAELDGMVLLSSCDKTTPAHLMAAARLNIPSLVLACGYQLGGTCRGRSVDIETLYNAVGTYKAGQINLNELTDMSREAIRGPGVCAGLATANTMHIMAEALGMTLPGNAPIRAGSDRLFAMARLAGRRIVGIVEEDLRPRDILSDGAFRNAVTVAVALGTSVNTVRHLAAIANQAESGLDIVGEVEKAAARIPLIAEIRPNGETRIEEFDAAGGCLAAMTLLRSELDTEARIAAGGNLGALIDRTVVSSNRHLRPLSDPFSADPGLAILRGSLAPDGAVVKIAAVPREIRRFEGKARVFESETDAIERLAGNHPEKLKHGDVAVLRMMGPKGGPGTVFAASFMAALQGTDLRGQVAVVTDGELSGLNSGITVGQVMPEAAEGGPLAWVEDGDKIVLDLDARRIDLLVDERVLKMRAGSGLSLPDAPKGWLSIYRETVGPLSRGAVVGDKIRK